MRQSELENSSNWHTPNRRATKMVSGGCRVVVPQAVPETAKQVPREDRLHEGRETAIWETTDAVRERRRDREPAAAPPLPQAACVLLTLGELRSPILALRDAATVRPGSKTLGC